MIDLRERLSPHFTLREMVRTSHRQFDNTPTPEIIERLRRLCIFFLEPVRQRFGPLWITSGYRSKNVNHAVGSTSKTSAHMYGCAADFVPMRYGLTPTQVVAWITDESGLEFDQVIDEYNWDESSNWVHLGIVRPVGNQKARRSALTMRKAKFYAFDRGDADEPKTEED